MHILYTLCICCIIEIILYTYFNYCKLTLIHLCIFKQESVNKTGQSSVQYKTSCSFTLAFQSYSPGGTTI